MPTSFVPTPASHLRILHVVDSLETGGLERVVTNLAIAQKAHGNDVRVFSINQTQGFTATLTAAGVPVIQGNKSGTLDWRVIRLLRSAARSADVVHSHNFVPNYYAAFALFGMLNAPVLTSTCHDMGARLSNRRLRWLYRLSLLMTARVAMVGQQVCNHFVQAGYVAAERAQTVLNGVPVDQFTDYAQRRGAMRKSLGIGEDTPVIGCVGRLVALKNHALLIGLLPTLLAQHPQLRVVLAGDGPMAAELQAQAQSLGVAQHVMLMGAVHNVELLLPAFDVFALPSKTEGLSIALLEACAAGIAAVASRVGGNPEIIQDGVTGRLVAVDDADDLLQALNELLQDAALRHQWGRSAQQWVTNNASVHALMQAYDQFYRTAMEA